MRLSPLIRRELEACPLPWTIEERKRNTAIRIAGRLVGTLGHGHHHDVGHTTRNIRAAIRRFVRERTQ
ncbi:hypothetical protein [Aureimonas psammosilenae]|uniref:hypothetical protein n=1 Tax=Aureimonas psammosilenae TaxID=2495496 RepID=UPI0012609FD4|nr:hypothetical protein [Aureimonas psammosilenae]